MKSLHVGSLISSRAQAFLPYVIGETVELAMTIYQGAGLSVRVPSELLEAWTLAKWSLTYLSSLLNISRPGSGQFPGARYNPCSHLVGNSVSSMKLWVIQEFLIPSYCW